MNLSGHHEKNGDFIERPPMEADAAAAEERELIESMRETYPTPQSFAEECIRKNIDRHIVGALAKKVYTPEEMAQISRIIEEYTRRLRKYGNNGKQQLH